ncbi:MAG: hypothetical protein K0V04_17480 [Deltaproteobacteria bacterium]|nr:hypothetical protein [Deltaproteobacteria bacterium]
MIGAKHFDPVLGIDIHMIQPPGPVPPIPVPHPAIGMLLDPADYAPWIGATVNVNGVPRAQAGTAGVMIPPHIPIGGIFVKPPSNEFEVFMGSSTVAADGDAQSRLGLPALSCSDIGIPAPPRAKGSPPKSLCLPTSVVLAVPMGPPVNVGGGPTISLSALAMRGVMAGLGGAFKKLKGLAKGDGAIGRAAKAISAKARKGADKLADALKLGDNARNKMKRAICAVTGHPVDIATGKVFTDAVDIHVDWPLPFRLERVWYSTSTYVGPLGHGWHHSYDMAVMDSGELLVVRMDDGRLVGFERPSPGQPCRNDAEMLVLKVGADRRYRLEDRGGDGRTFVFGAGSSGPLGVVFHRLTTIRDVQGRWLEFVSERGRVVAVESSNGHRIRLRHDAQGRVVGVYGPDPERPAEQVRLVSYQYSEAGDLVAVTDALGGSTRFQYRDHLMTRDQDRNGYSFHFEWDGTGGPKSRCTRTWGDGGYLARTLRYDLDAGVTWVEDSRGNTRCYHWNELGLVEKEADPRGNVTVTEYDDDGRLLRTVDPLGNVATHTRDDRGRETMVRLTDGATYHYEYNDADQLVSVVDHRGARSMFCYDDDRRLVETHAADGSISRNVWGPHGLAAVVLPGGVQVTMRYGAVGLVEVMEFSDGTAIEHQFDVLGRATSTHGRHGSVERFRHDLLGQMTAAEDDTGMQRRYTYDAEGNLVGAHDSHTAIDFGFSNHQLMRTRQQAGSRASFEYDSEGNPLEIRNEHGQRHRWRFDDNNLPHEVIDFRGNRRRYAFDAAQRVDSIEHEDGRRSKWAYDPFGRMTRADYDDGTALSFEYAPGGDIVAATRGSCRTAFEYDLVGRVVEQSQGEHWVRSRYDADGRRVEVETSLGLKQSIAWNDRSLPRHVKVELEGEAVWAAEFTHGQDLSETARLPGSVIGVRTFDAFQRPLSHEVRCADEAVHAKRYTWGKGLRLLSLTDGAHGERRFAYDEVDRLHGVHEPDGSYQPHVVDVVGNLIESGPGGPRRHDPAGALVAYDGWRYEYDARGNLVSREHGGGARWRYTWSDRGELVQVCRPDGTEITFEYDAGGRRVSKTCGDVRTRWLWDGDLPIHEWTEVAAEGEPKGEPGNLRSWVHEPHRAALLVQLEERAALSVITDHIGTPEAMLDAAGVEVWRARLGLRGQWLDGSEQIHRCPFRFFGQYHDQETGLYYNRYRYYDPHGGGYISADPLELEGDGHLYGYVFNPLVATDPLGLHKVTATLTDAAGNTEPVTGPRGGKAFYSDPKAKTIPGRTGDSEQKLIKQLEANPATNGKLKGSTLKVKSEGGVFKAPNGKIVGGGPLNPCPDCQNAMKKFSKKHSSTVEYWKKDKLWKWDKGKLTVNGKVTPCK